MKKINILLLSIIFLLLGCNGNDNDKKELFVYNWTTYIAENTISDFETATSIDVTYDNFSNNEELLAKMQAGAKGYDVIFPSDYMVDVMMKEDLLLKIEPSKIPNNNNLLEKFRSLRYNNGTDIYAVPYLWGTVGIGIDTSKVKEYSSSWDMLFDEKYKGKISMLDDMRFGMIPALKNLGYSINTKNTQELEEAKNLMLSQKTLVRAFTSDTYINLLKSGEVWIAYGYSGDIYQAASQNKDIIYLVPEEGTAIWVDNMCIPKSAPNPNLAKQFINYMLEGKVGADISNSTLYANPNREAKKYIDDKIVNNPNIYISDTLIRKSEFLNDIGEATKEYSKTWSEIKAY